MKLTAFVISQNSQPLEGTTVLLTDQDGKVIPGSPFTQTDDSGAFTLESPLLDKETTYVELSQAGYRPARYQGKYLYGEIVLEENEGSALDAVVVTAKIPKKKSGNINYILPISMAATSIGIFGYIAYKKGF